MRHPYIAALLLSAEYEADSDGTTFGQTQAFPGVTVTALTYLRCRHQLAQVLEEAVIVALIAKTPLPPLYGVVLPTTPTDIRRRAA
jgi:hypothetical protein